MKSRQGCQQSKGEGATCGMEIKQPTFDCDIFPKFRFCMTLGSDETSTVDSKGAE